MQARDKVTGTLEDVARQDLVRNRRFLDDEQLIRSEQLAVLEEIFNGNVRDRELREISAHFGPVLRNDHPAHLALWGKTGTGKTLTMMFFLNLLAELCRKRRIPMQHVHLDLVTPRPCFRALNDLACLLNASKRYQKGISLEELMLRITVVSRGRFGRSREMSVPLPEELEGRLYDVICSRFSLAKRPVRKLTDWAAR
ncbi:MAG: hypothetical protein V1790_04455 [Planctomycetota bacterium]